MPVVATLTRKGPQPGRVEQPGHHAVEPPVTGGTDPRFSFHARCLPAMAMALVSSDDCQLQPEPRAVTLAPLTATSTERPPDASSQCIWRPYAIARSGTGMWRRHAVPHCPASGGPWASHLVRPPQELRVGRQKLVGADERVRGQTGV